MRAATAVGATAILILVTEVWACAAGAEDAIKSGKWEYWIVGSKIPEPPPGTKLPPSTRWGPEGMITSVCISETDPPARQMHTPSPETRELGNGSCDSDMNTDATTATRSFSMNCEWSSGNKSNIEGVMHFHEDTLDGTATGRYSFPDHPTNEYSLPIKGRYVGPCDPK
jgi:hypothetical protein